MVPSRTAAQGARGLASQLSRGTHEPRAEEPTTVKTFVAPLTGALIASIGVVTLAGCGGSPASVGLAVPPNGGSLGTASVGTASTLTHGRSWASPEARTHDLLYISDLENQNVAFYSYPGLQPMGVITGFFNPEGLCVNKAGDVWVTNDTNEGVHQVTEYAHGSTTPMANLIDPQGSTLGCSVDFKNGDLAVTDFFGTHGQGGVSIWKNAQGAPTLYVASNIYYYWYCGYDGKGNLYTDGFDSGSSMSIAVLHRGKHKFQAMNVPGNNPFWYPGGVQWDGKYLAVGDEYGPIYQYSVKGNTNTLVNTITLNQENEIPQFWIHGTTVIAPNSNGHNTLLYPYPGGGDPTANIAGNDPTGSTISPAK
jgi:hypothetical protein